MTDASPALAALKPCPFCGEGTKIVPYQNRENKWGVYCGMCHASATYGFTTQSEAVGAWNSRRPSSSPEAMAQGVGDLAEALGEIAMSFFLPERAEEVSWQHRRRVIIRRFRKAIEENCVKSAPQSERRATA